MLKCLKKLVSILSMMVMLLVLQSLAFSSGVKAETRRETTISSWPAFEGVAKGIAPALMPGNEDFSIDVATVDAITASAANLSFGGNALCFGAAADGLVYELYTSAQTTDRRIVVQTGVTVCFILNGIDMTNETLSAFELQGTAKVTIWLVDKTENNFECTYEMAIVVGASSGIAVPEGATLEINGAADEAEAGTLNVKGGYGGAGIGGYYSAVASQKNAGTIIINGGIVNATSIKGAGIGGGIGSYDYVEDDYQDGGSGGTIIINGGMVTAIGGDGMQVSAGIGGGGGDPGSGTGGEGGMITINGGIVTAVGGYSGGGVTGSGAGIGGGGGYIGGEGGSILIQGGIVTANGGSCGGPSNGSGAGIGGGGGSYGGAGNGGEITIKGGTIIATAGVTSGSANDGGAGVGGGGAAVGAVSGGDGGTITMENCTVIATGSDNGAGIGGGGGTSDGGVGGMITITSSNVTATGGYHAAGGGAGIGGGMNFSMQSSATVSIDSASTVKAYAAGRYKHAIDADPDTSALDAYVVNVGFYEPVSATDSPIKVYDYDTGSAVCEEDGATPIELSLPARYRNFGYTTGGTAVTTNNVITVDGATDYFVVRTCEPEYEEYSNFSTMKTNDILSKQNLQYHQVWLKDFYTVTFDAKGGIPVPSAQFVSLDDLVQEPNAPQKENYIFDGWYLKDGTWDGVWAHLWDFDNDTVDNDMTLYAKWLSDLSAFTITIEYYYDNTTGQPIATETIVQVSNGSKIMEAIEASLGADWLNAHKTEYRKDGVQVTAFGPTDIMNNEDVMIQVVYEIAPEILGPNDIVIIYYVGNINSKPIGEIWLDATNDQGRNVLETVDQLYRAWHADNSGFGADWLRAHTAYGQGKLMTDIAATEVVNGTVILEVVYPTPSVNTGDMMMSWPFFLLALSIMLAAGSLMFRKRRPKANHGESQP